MQYGADAEEDERNRNVSPVRPQIAQEPLHQSAVVDLTYDFLFHADECTNGQMLNWSHVETLNGVLVVDKPSSWTSHDVVNKVRRFTGTKKVGHLGTLDPMATGVLPLLIGRATRLAQFFGKADKVYEGTIEFGYATDTYDAEGKPTSESVPVTLDRDCYRKTYWRRFQGKHLTGSASGFG